MIYKHYTKKTKLPLPPHKKPMVNSSAPEGLAVPALRVTPVMLLLLNDANII